MVIYTTSYQHNMMRGAVSLKDYEMEDRPKRSLNPLKFFFSKDAEEGNVPNRELVILFGGTCRAKRGLWHCRPMDFFIFAPMCCT